MVTKSLDHPSKLALEDYRAHNGRTNFPNRDKRLEEHFELCDDCKQMAKGQPATTFKAVQSLPRPMIRLTN